MGNANNNKGDLHTLAATISGYPIYFEKVSGKSKRYSINLGKDDQIVVGAWNSFVYVNFQNATKEHFGDSKGLMGSFPDGLKLGRDSKTIFEDMNAFGQEWQVLSSEPKAFHTYNGQQNSNECYIPSSKEMRHRLEASEVTLIAAKKSCLNVDKETMDLCVFDVMATNDVSTAGAYQVSI